MDRLDSHSHIIQADISEMVASAKANKLHRYSITEHISQFRPIRQAGFIKSYHSTGRIFEDLDEYRAEFSKVDGYTLAGMQLRKGLEVDFIPRHQQALGDFVNRHRWDVLLCSVHEFDDGVDVEAPRAHMPDNEVDRLWRRYFGLERMALESDFIPFTVLTHPTRMMKGTKRVPDNLDGILLDLATVAARRGKALELNGKDLDTAPEVVRRVAEACKKAGCRVSLGSDSHTPKDVYRNMDAAAEMVEELGLQVV
jgi:histidinol-phosphatase (PHP family)